MERLNILITGGSSGIGKASAEHFFSLGHTVFTLDVVPFSDNEKIKGFVADIRDEEALIKVRQTLEGMDVKLDAIICVAGVHAMASLVEDDFDKIKRLIDINLCGTMLTGRVFHSLLKEKGRIVIVTSEVATYAPMPFNGLYNISKTALEAYAQALRQELNLIGQRVITVRPGATLTPLEGGSKDATRLLAENTVYYKRQAKHFENLVKSFTGTPVKPEVLAKVIYKATLARHPRLSYAKHRNIGLVLLSILPKRLQCFIVKLLLNRK